MKTKISRVAMEIGQHSSENENEISRSFYDVDFLDDFVDNDMITDAEGGFMRGYLDEK